MIRSKSQTKFKLNFLPPLKSANKIRFLWRTKSIVSAANRIHFPRVDKIQMDKFHRFELILQHDSSYFNTTTIRLNLYCTLSICIAFRHHSIKYIYKNVQQLYAYERYEESINAYWHGSAINIEPICDT